MPQLPLILLPLLALAVFALPRKFKALYTGLITLATSCLALIPAFDALVNSVYLQLAVPLPLAQHGSILVDKLSALFVGITCIVFTVSAFYNHSHFARHELGKNDAQVSLHLFFQVQLLYALLFVLVARDAFLFLFAWEYMAICSFLLLIFNGHERSKIRSAIAFFIQMHAGFFMLLLAFARIENATESFSFDAIGSYFALNANLPVFLLFFFAFSIKAGLVPMHTWLPDTYSKMPASAGGVMSGVVTNMGIYGMARVLTYVQSDFLAIASIILSVSLFTTIYGVCMAAIQKDIKRLLAYSSIENMGIVGIGLGLGMLGQAVGNDFLMITGFSGALLHVFSHALVKALLFMSAGSVCAKVGTQNLERMGGLIKFMPRASLLFLAGSAAICALPPFMGFVSEFVLYSGVLGSLRGWGYSVTGFGVASLAALSASGGVAILAFSKAIGIGFLGQSRSTLTDTEARNASYYALLALLGLVVLLGAFPMLFVKSAYQIVTVSFPIPDAVFIRQSMIYTLSRASVAVGCMLFLAGGIFALRHYLLRKRKVAQGPTWACGATVAAPRVQYTAGSYSGEFAALTQPLNRSRRGMESVSKDSIFPTERRFSSVLQDIFRTSVRPLIKRVSLQLNKLAIFQTGRVHHYVLYALLFMILIFLLTYFNFI